MAISNEETARLFRQGDFTRLLTLSGRNVRTISALDPHVRVVVAHALTLSGDLEIAHQVAELDTTARTPLRIRSYAESVIGLVLWRNASMDAALRHLQTAVRIANDSADDDRIAWAQLQLLRCLIDSHPHDVVVAMLPDVRRSVTRAGDPQITAYLHSCIAVLSGQMGHLDEARRHCDITEALLELAPNSWILGNSLLTRGTLATLTRELDEAFEHVAAAKKALTSSGQSRAMVACDASLAHLQLLTGQFEKARHALSRLIEDPRTPRSSLIGLSESFARACLAEGRLVECRAALERADFEARQNPSVAGYDVRWAAITLARLLMKEHKFAEAAAWLRTRERAAASVADGTLNAELNLACARADMESNNPELAAARLVAAHEAGILGIKELQGRYYFGAAQLLGDSSSTLARQLRQRAMALWDTQGVVADWLEMERNQPSAETARKQLFLAGGNEVSPVRNLECLTNALASLIDLAHSPALFGREIVGILRALDCSPRAAVVEEPTSGLLPAPLGVIKVSLGRGKKSELTLECQLPETSVKAILLADVLRIGRAALELERARQEERNRAAIWPALPIEEQAGALFLAEEMQQLLATVRRIASSMVPVLITGETGTGKEVLARTLHLYSARATATFLPFNCSSIHKDMLESQLFGHRRGSFTGAIDNFPGVIRAASGGTLFLDEIAELSLEVQPKLLRFLESNEIHPMGDVRPVHADVRLIAATNADLAALVAQGRFREDLFYRLNIVPLHVPPLRERRIEIPALANHYLHKYALENRRGDLRLAEETMEYLMLYRWPGNVRQLANEMRRLAALSEPGAVLMPEHLSAMIAASRRTIPASERTLDPTEVVVRIDQPMPAAVRHLERTMIQRALRASGGGMDAAAAMLGLSRKGLYLKRVRYGLEPPESTASYTP